MTVRHAGDHAQAPDQIDNLLIPSTHDKLVVPMVPDHLGFRV